MSQTFTGPGRPSADEALRRKGRFLALIAEGHDAEQAAKAARIGPWRALRIVTETDFLEIVQAIRAGLGPVTVEIATDTNTDAQAA